MKNTMFTSGLVGTVPIFRTAMMTFGCIGRNLGNGNQDNDINGVKMLINWMPFFDNTSTRESLMDFAEGSHP